MMKMPLYTQENLQGKKEGIFAGYSCGAAIKGVLQLKKHFSKNDIVVVLLHDSGSRYVGKMYNDDWMRRKVSNSINHLKVSLGNSYMLSNPFELIETTEKRKLSIIIPSRVYSFFLLMTLLNSQLGADVVRQ